MRESGQRWGAMRRGPGVLRKRMDWHEPECVETPSAADALIHKSPYPSKRPTPNGHSGSSSDWMRCERCQRLTHDVFARQYAQSPWLCGRCYRAVYYEKRPLNVPQRRLSLM